MAVTSKASTVWSGALADGHGTTSLDTSGVATFEVDWKARSAGGGTKTTPEELLAAAHASCFSMALSHQLGQNETPPQELRVNVAVEFEAGVGVRGAVIDVEGVVPGVDEETFASLAEGAKANCPISKALAGIEIRLGSVRLVPAA
ncbi:MAG: OsmC family peroxiredoxin [Naasia sp.]|nr:OsmC family peroxiredoxin [Naasia sp.]